MAFATNIRAKLRNIIGENTKTSKDVFVFSSSRIFSLTEENAIAITTVFKNDVVVSESGNWSYSSTTNKLTFTDGYSLTSGDVIQINYTYYPNYSDTELNGYINTALSYISINQYKTFDVQDDDINPEPDSKEENLIAIVAGILIKPDNKSYRLPDISVTVPIRTTMPTDDMIAKTVAAFKKNSHGVFTLLNNWQIVI